MKFKKRDSSNGENGKSNSQHSFKPVFLKHYEEGRLPLAEQGEHRVLLRRLLASSQTQSELTAPSVNGRRADEYRFCLQTALQTLVENKIVRRSRAAEPVFSIMPGHLQHVRYYITRRTT